MKVHTQVVGAFQENCYLVVDEGTRGAVFVDPGAEPERLLAALAKTGARLEGIWLTHAHPDHVGAVAGIRRAMPEVPIWLHPAEAPLYGSAGAVAEQLGLRAEQPPPADHELAEGDALTLGTLSFDVLHLPGHAPGHVVFTGHGVAFVGDCVFAGSVGRTDLPYCDTAMLGRSLERIAGLPPETVLYPGHGPATTIGRELEGNPYLNGTVRIAGAR